MSTSTFQQWREPSKRNINDNMATATKVYLTPEHSGLVKSQSPTTESAVKASELLQKNHDHHHTFYNADGYHNHIAHQLLSLYGLGAPADVLEKQYELNASYQRPLPKLEENIVDDMSDPANFKKYLGNEKYYHDFLRFFEREIGKKGWENVVNEYMFAGDERAEDMLIRMYAGFLHPLIHLGFGIEFKQPAIVAEALAQTAVHAPAIGNLLIPAEKAASANSTSKKTLPELLDEIRANKKLSTAAHWNDPNKVYNGILVRAPQEMINICSQWSASENNLEEKTAEMINAAIYFTAGAQHPPKQVKFDFYFMHCVNASIFFPTFNAQPWLSTASKVRLLNFKVWLDLAMYASRRSPEPLLEEITMYVPKDFEAAGGEWSGIFKRLFALEDDGHAIKLARAVRNAEIVSHGFGDEKVDRIKGFMFEKIGNMVVDSVEDSGSHWVRSAGFDEAWVNFVDRRRSVHL